MREENIISKRIMICPPVCGDNPRDWGGWSGGAKVLGKLSVPGRPTVWIIERRGPTVLAVGAGGVVWTFFLSSIISFFFLPLSGRRPDID